MGKGLRRPLSYPCAGTQRLDDALEATRRPTCVAAALSAGASAALHAPAQGVARRPLSCRHADARQLRAPRGQRQERATYVLFAPWLPRPGAQAGSHASPPHRVPLPAAAALDEYNQFTDSHPAETQLHYATEAMAKAYSALLRCNMLLAPAAPPSDPTTDRRHVELAVSVDNLQQHVSARTSGFPVMLRRWATSYVELGGGF